MDLKKPAILSISLLTVMTNAAVAPLLGLISASFPSAGITLIKQVVTLPSLMIIFFSIISGQLVRILSKKLILAIGLCTYLISGFSTQWADSITSLLFLRALTGAGAGLIVPLAASFITDFYSGKEQAEMVGYSTFTAYFGAALAPLAAGWIVGSTWQNAFYIYLIAAAVLAFTMISIPKNVVRRKENEKRGQKQINFAVISMALVGCGVYILFYLMPTDVSFLIATIGNMNPSSAAVLLAIEILAAASAGVVFSKATHKLGAYAFTIGFVLLAGGFILVNFAHSFTLLAACMIIIGLGIGTIRPVIYLRTAQVSLPESTTSSFAFVNSGFSLGQFISPIFYYGVSSAFSFDLVTGNYMIAAIIFSIAVIASLIAIRAGSSINQVR